MGIYATQNFTIFKSDLSYISIAKHFRRDFIFCIWVMEQKDTIIKVFRVILADNLYFIRRLPIIEISSYSINQIS